MDSKYEPVITVKQLVDKNQESTREHYQRCAEVAKKILNEEWKREKEGSGGVVLLIGHGTTVDSVSRALLGKETEEMCRAEIDRIGLHFPYCAVAGLEQLKLSRSRAEYRWALLRNPLPPITCLEFSNRLDYQFINR